MSIVTLSDRILYVLHKDPSVRYSNFLEFPRTDVKNKKPLPTCPQIGKGRLRISMFFITNFKLLFELNWHDTLAPEAPVAEAAAVEETAQVTLFYELV